MTKKKKLNILLTGGAGFIGSHIAEALLHDERVGIVRVLDNFSTGFRNNIESFMPHSQFEFIEGDIRDFETCLRACEGMDLISHQAALGSVPRSIKDPLTTNAVNVTGTLHIFQAAAQNNIKRVIYAASSSTYGDSQNLPKVEKNIGNPLSPYAVTKYVNELYADVLSRMYGIEYFGLRYFNVFGPRQDPNGPYAAVIPLFMKAAIENTPPIINGDGTFSRDFTYIDNAVEANVKALFTDQIIPSEHRVFNVACGKKTDLNTLWALIKEITGCTVKPIHGPYREGDIPHSLADITLASKWLGYTGSVKIREGLEKTYRYNLQETGSREAKH